jgi:hypothetical protein
LDRTARFRGPGCTTPGEFDPAAVSVGTIAIT